jgi:uncharacterized protein (TIGR02246 family)
MRAKLTVSTPGHYQDGTRSGRPALVSSARRPGKPLPAIWAGLALASALAAGCASSPPRAADRESDRQDIQRTLERYVEASRSQDAAALAALYADDAVLLPPEEEMVVGREAIERFWQDGMEPGLSVETVRVQLQGEAGYLIGRYTLPATDDAPADSGKTVLCFRREAGGRWAVTADIWNSSSAHDDAEDGDEKPAPGAVVTRTAAPYRLFTMAQRP